MSDDYRLFVLAVRVTGRPVFEVVTGAREDRQPALAYRGVLGGMDEFPGIAGIIYLRNLDAGGTDIERPEDQPFIVIANADDRRHTGAIRRDHKVCSRLHADRPVLGIDDAEIHARKAERVDHRHRRHDDERPYDRFAGLKFFLQLSAARSHTDVLRS